MRSFGSDEPLYDSPEVNRGNPYRVFGRLVPACPGRLAAVHDVYTASRVDGGKMPDLPSVLAMPSSRFVGLPVKPRMSGENLGRVWQAGTGRRNIAVALFIRQTVSAAGPAGAAARTKASIVFPLPMEDRCGRRTFFNAWPVSIIRLEDSRIFESFTPEFAKERVIADRCGPSRSER